MILKKKHKKLVVIKDYF